MPLSSAGAVGSASRGPCKAAIYLRHTAKVDSAAVVTCISGDSKMLLLGCFDGSIQLLTWLGKVRRDELGAQHQHQQQHHQHAGWAAGPGAL